MWIRDKLNFTFKKDFKVMGAFDERDDGQVVTSAQ